MKKVIYIVCENADFIEGRGPMLFHSAYETLEAAKSFVMNQNGIYGSQQSEYVHLARDGYYSYNGYDIRATELVSNVAARDSAKHRRRMQQLDDDIDNAQDRKKAYLKSVGLD